MDTTVYARLFRGSMPYISAHRNRTFVVLLSGEAMAHGNLANIVHDLALLHVLGVRIVVVHGARPQIEAALPDSQLHEQRRVTLPEHMQAITGIYGQQKAELEALFSTGLPNTPLHNVDIHVTSGNFITAYPLGVVNGVDHLLSGRVRRVHTQRIGAALTAGSLILQAPIGYSPSGQAFNLASLELAAEIAINIKADKLIAFDGRDSLVDDGGMRISSVSPSQLRQFGNGTPAETQTLFAQLARSVDHGVGKAHLVSYAEDGALLAELFTAEGVGTQVLPAPPKAVRPATFEDVAGIVELIRPLEEAGTLVRRDRDRLEQEIENFLVAELDQVVVGCCAVYPFNGAAELACVAVHANYRNLSGISIGAQLLAAAENRARELHLPSLFVLTTQTRDWFLEQGFADAAPDMLPAEKQTMYNWQRGSKVMTKTV